MFGMRERIGGKFLGFERLASTLWIPQVGERLMTVIHRTLTSSVHIAVLSSCALELLVEAPMTELVKTRQCLGILRNVSAVNALATTTQTSSPTSCNLTLLRALPSGSMLIN